MSAKALLVTLLFVGMGIAGCLKPGDDAPAAEKVDQTDFNKANPNGNTTLVAFEETNKTEAGFGGVDHHHDMWNGASRVILFEEVAQMEPGVGDNGATAEFKPPQGRLVYEGTASIEFTISDPERRACEPVLTLSGDFVCTDNAATYAGGPETPRAPDPSPPTGLKLRYKHASTTNWIDVGDIAWGVPTTIKVNDALQTDMPHATSTLWEFQIESPNAHDGTLSFTAKAEMIRSEGEIPVWPGHPDFYVDKTSRVVLDMTGAQACEGASCAGSEAEKAVPVHAQKLISYGTRTLHVWLNVSDVSAPNPALAPTNWFAYHLNATGRNNLTDPFDAEAGAEKREFYWILPVDDNGMDSPYADGSRWTFQLGGSLTTPALSCYSGCADWFATYGLVVHATNEILPFESYHYRCLRAEECPEPTG